MERVIKCQIEALFVVDSYYPENKRFLKFSLLELIPEYTMDLTTITQLQQEIEEWDIGQRDVLKLNIYALDEEKEYKGKFNVELIYYSSYDNWSGATEYDGALNLECVEYAEYNGRGNELEYSPEYSRIFHASGNKDCDYIYMKLLSSGRIHIEFAHCCVKHKGHFIDVTTLTACLAEHLGEYRKKYE